MIFLIAQGPEEIEHFAAAVLALFAERLDEGVVELFHEVAAGDDGRGDVFEGEEGGGWWVTRFPFEVVGDVDEEVKALFGGPEEGVDHYGCGVWAGGRC